MQLALLFAGAVLAFTMTRVQGHEVVVCPPNNQQLITRSRSLLPLENIQASSDSPTYSSAAIVSAGGWCSNAPSFVGEYVNFTFTQPVVLTMIISSSAFSSYYVNNFSIQYRPLEDRNGSFLDIYGITEMPQNFFVPQRERFFTLEESIVTTKLQLTINDGVATFGTDTCWIVTMLGCQLSEAETIGTESEMTSTVTPSVVYTSTANPSPTSLAPIPACQSGPGVNTTSGQASRGGATREEVLAITLPIALGTIVIVAVGVVICLKHQRKEKWSPSMQYSTIAKASEPGAVTTAGGGCEGQGSHTREREATLRKVDNALYEGSMSVDHQPRDRVDTLREVENVLYGDNIDRSEEQTYESVAGSVLRQHQHLEESIDVIQNISYSASVASPAGPSAGNED